ncbi:OmpA-related protein [Paludibacter propionicigenes WB4]|uniref:OmpA-related protein n=1 Tax=Paludibacter propionicigenes (strain DSM 17365 / JCM 13257 / WB4) TaxID=694427 RepID=E4T2M6_PALPW|nr:TonB-dependent receptor [Paludibacter propionicigenes]ADQ78970.1 OmpA-related protein [Paludibacter propionicigenes WB4]
MIKQLKFLVLSLLLFSATMNAQVTTSGISGKVTSNGEPIFGVSIIATHTPSGTTYRSITNIDGRYDITGMRVGGPYTVKVSFIGYSKETISGIQLQLGEIYPLSIQLKEGSKELSEVVVTKQRTKFLTEKTGASTNISSENIASMPTISRSVSDIARLSPYASGMSFAGSDGRSTNFTVDGANFNNNFGLSSSLPGGGNPISLDAIEEIQVVVTPYDVRQTNFIGGGINAITKSGTNTFKGSAYTFFTNQNLRGNKIGDYDFGSRKASSKKVYGLTLGGPIIKNKLFFFVNAETEKKPGQVVTWRPSANGISDGKTLSRASIADMDAVHKFLLDNYGYDAGSYTDYPGDENNKKFLARIDWNINEKNKLNVRYNYTKNIAWNPTNGNSTDAGSRNQNMDRISQYGMAFSNSLYSMNNIVKSLSAELNTRLNEKMSNQFLTTYTKIDDVRGSNSDKFPFVDILAGRAPNGNPIIEPYISAGYELFTWNNGVHNKNLTFTDNFTYYLDKHKITAGLSYEHQMANNAYMRNGTAYYRYASLSDFINKAAPIDFALTYGYDGESNPNAQVSFNQYGAYIQDEWNIKDNLKITYGIRADELKFVDNIIRNNAIYNLDFGGRKIDTGTWPSAKTLFSPRLGFTWDVFNDKSFKVRGGTGIFTGRLPLVFFTNMPTNAGMVQGSYKATTTYNTNGSIKTTSPALATLAGGMITDVDKLIEKLGLPKTITPETGALPSEIAGVDPNFKMPQVWKSSIALDYQIPASFPLSVTVEGIYTKTLNAVMLTNYNLKDPDATWTRFSGPDNRYIYPANYKYSTTNPNAYVLTNTDKGWGAIGNITINATPIKNLNLMAAYTHTESKEITGMPGSNASSAYGGLSSVDGPQLPTLQRSQYVTPNKIIASLSYKLPYANNSMATSLNLFYSGYSTGGYSYTYSTDMNGDGWKTDLIYIPARRGDVKFLTPADEDAFFAYMAQDKYLSSHKGKYAEANAARAPWVNNVDLRLTQDFKFRVGENTNTLQLSFDVLNFGNLLNSKWGIAQNMSSSNNGQILKYESKDANNVPTYSVVKIKDPAGNMVYPTQSFSTVYSYSQTWSLQIGLKYIFN